MDDDAVYFRLRWSPYSSCIPAGTLTGADGGHFTCDRREYHPQIVRDYAAQVGRSGGRRSE